MVAINLLPLFLVLPTLALASHNSPLDARSPHRRHNHARAASFAVGHASDSVMKRAASGSIEEKMARKRDGKDMAKVAKRAADGSKCRKRGESYTPTGVSSTLSASSTVVSSTEVISSAVSTTDVSSTSAWTETVETSASTQASSTDAESSSIVNQQVWVDDATSTSSSVAAPTSTTSAAAASTSSASSSTGSSVVSYANLTPNGNKAGLSAGDALPWVKDHIGWWYDWSANPSGDSGSAVAIPCIWGSGSADSTDASRLSVFSAITSTPSYIIGFEEPDCDAGSGSSGFDVATGIALWDSLVAPHGDAGSVLVGPSMCKQAAESGWLSPFLSAVTRKPDVMNIHVNKNSAAGINTDIDHYWNTYGLPIWVTEFACVDDSSSFIPCTDQSEINTFIQTAVDIFENDYRIAGYAYSNGDGLSDAWAMVKNGALSESGQTYLAAISKYH
ncbi:hypothetical protein B9479_003334 [Cryptococcus floricola]|uniref:Asl1-like glycosyl hydrolase catalytic domain-containing protein n=1 Tax=Cryptococcus floricola TaxID=2591691 RepID=A0A5D3B0J5_9TREE|nr:hypothetical protein B9479_003334 [Cryptococcus floricola]